MASLSRHQLSLNGVTGVRLLSSRKSFLPRPFTQLCDMFKALRSSLCSIYERLSKSQLSTGEGYPLISPDGKEFRLLKIHPRVLSASNIDCQSIESTPIRCDLFVASRDASPDYQALSYTWGDPLDTVSIQVNGSALQIGRNLYTALEHIRQEHEDVVLWADAICIDENNNKEKSKQVEHMTDIYASAKRTIVWLGPSGDGSDGLLESCKKIAEQLAKLLTVDGMVISSIDHLFSELYDPKTEAVAGQERSRELKRMLEHRMTSFVDENQQDTSKGMCFLKALRNLLLRGYWRRVWVHQEFVVSSDILIQCGHSKIKEADFRASLLYSLLLLRKVVIGLHEKANAIREGSTRNIKLKWSQWVMDDYPEDNDDPDLAEFICIRKQTRYLLDQHPNLSVFGLRRSYHKLQPSDEKIVLTLIRTLASVFVGHEAAEATIAKDRIFAMLGMAADKEELGLKPDYNETTSTVYTKAALAIITTGHVDLLSLSQHRRYFTERQRSTAEFPSWVPDWRYPISRPSGQLPWNTSFTVSGDVLFEKSPGLASCLAGQVELYGWVLDTIEELSPMWVEPDEGISKNAHNIQKFLADISKLCETSNTKFGFAGHEIYSCASNRQSAHFIVPVAGQELEETMGVVWQAGEGSLQGYAALNEALVDLLPLDSANVDESKMTKICKIEGAMYVEAMRHQKFHRQFLSSSGYVGLAPGFAEQGDVLVIFRGAKFPYVLRRNIGGTYTFIRDVYVHGIMYGKFMASPRVIEKFVLQ